MPKASPNMSESNEGQGDTLVTTKCQTGRDRVKIGEKGPASARPREGPVGEMHAVPGVQRHQKPPTINYGLGRLAPTVALRPKWVAIKINGQEMGMRDENVLLDIDGWTQVYRKGKKTGYFNLTTKQYSI